MKRSMPPLNTNPGIPIPLVSLLGNPPHAMRHLPHSPRSFVTASDVVRVGSALSELPTDTSTLNSLTKVQTALHQKKEQRIATYQLSAVDINAFSALTHLSAEYRAYFLTRPVNQEAANARLLCMLLGKELVTKAMDVKHKSSKAEFSGGFLRVATTQVPKPDLAKLSDRFPTLKRTTTSFRLLEKSGEFYNIKLDVPLSFIYSLHAQKRIKDPSIEMLADGIYLKVESNDKVGAIKWRCKFLTLPAHIGAVKLDLRERRTRAKLSSDIKPHERPPEWYYALYYGSLPKEPARKDFDDIHKYFAAHTEYEEKLTYAALLRSWQEKIRTAPGWFKALQAAHPTLRLKWNLGQILNITEYQDGHYRDIIILGRTVNGKTLPLISDYDLFAVIPDRSMTDDEIWALQIEAGVLPEKRMAVLKRYDGIAMTLADLPDFLLKSNKLDLTRCFIDRKLYFDTLVELGPLAMDHTPISESDPRVRYKHNTLTGNGSLAEGDLTAVFNLKAAAYNAYYEAAHQESMAQMRAKDVSAKAGAGASAKHEFARTATYGASASATSLGATTTRLGATAEAKLWARASTKSSMAIDDLFIRGIGALAGAGVATETSRDKSLGERAAADPSYPLSAHHGPETANPKPEPLPWHLGMPQQGIFTCDPHGDFCQLCTPEEFISFSKAILEADKLYKTEHRIPLNGHWPEDFLLAVIDALRIENVLIFNAEASLLARATLPLRLGALPHMKLGPLTRIADGSESASTARSASTTTSVATAGFDEALASGEAPIEAHATGAEAAATAGAGTTGPSSLLSPSTLASITLAPMPHKAAAPPAASESSAAPTGRKRIELPALARGGAGDTLNTATSRSTTPPTASTTATATRTGLASTNALFPSGRQLLPPIRSSAELNANARPMTTVDPLSRPLV